MAAAAVAEAALGAGAVAAMAAAAAAVVAEGGWRGAISEARGASWDRGGPG